MPDRLAELTGPGPPLLTPVNVLELDGVIVVAVVIGGAVYMVVAFGGR